MHKREQAERRGRLAEYIALWYLRLKGYRLLAHRFKTPMGEIDLIMRKGDTTAFIEVKARITVDAAILSVTPMQARRISRAAATWMSKDKKAVQGVCRFDIVAIPSNLRPHHIINAFEGER